MRDPDQRTHTRAASREVQQPVTSFLPGGQPHHHIADLCCDGRPTPAGIPPPIGKILMRPHQRVGSVTGYGLQ
jgi:hypothetical protein